MKAWKIMFFTLTMMMAVWTSLLGQARDEWSIGPRGGVNFANVTNIDESQSITGVVLGLASTFSFQEHYGLNFEALYSVEGYKAPFTEYHLRYLQIPIYFDYFFGELGQRLRPKIYAGVMPGFYLGGTLNGLNTNDAYFNKSLFALSGGFGVNYRVGNRIWWNTDIRSVIGLSDIRDKSVRGEGEAIYPRNLQVTMALCYGLGKLK